MSSPSGNMLRLTLFGESHGEATGAVLEGFPAGFRPDMEKLHTFLERRRAKSSLHTARRETDTPRIISGLYEGMTTGTPLTVLFENHDQRPDDYDELRDCPRPGHADYPAYVCNGGFEDLRGGGHHSGRLTLPACFAGGLALQWLEAKGIRIGAHLLSVGDVNDDPLDSLHPNMDALSACHEKRMPVLSDEALTRMEAAIASAAAEGDSLGAVVECAAVGVPAGLGRPFFDGVESDMGARLFAIPGVKGVEFGDGFAASRLKGSMYNDPYRFADGALMPESNHAGGLLGGMTDGAPIIVRCAFRPTASIAKTQRTSDYHGQERVLHIAGRHDPCFAVRAVPVVESAAALTLMDLILIREGQSFAKE